MTAPIRPSRPSQPEEPARQESLRTLNLAMVFRHILAAGQPISRMEPATRGARGWSGELGHVTVHPDGKPCPCGSRGCLHTYASLEAILSDDPLSEGTSPDAAIAARAEAGDPGTLGALDVAGTGLGVALSDMLNILDIDTVLLGGSFSLLSSWLTANARTEIDQRVLTAAWAPVTIRAALLGPDAAVIGGRADLHRPDPATPDRLARQANRTVRPSPVVRRSTTPASTPGGMLPPGRWATCRWTPRSCRTR